MDTASTANVARRQAAQHAPTTQGLVTGAPLGKLAVPSTSTGALIAEVLILPAILLFVGYFFSPDDPLWVRAEFPWSWLAPVIVALRYGALAGLGASAVLLGGWFLFHASQWGSFPQLYFLGGLITVMVVGEFSSVWRNKTRRAELNQNYLDQRLEHLVRQYYLLRLSHDRLEQELIGRPMSMRDALQALQSASHAHEAPDRLLQLLGQYCQITEASLHPVKNGHVQSELLAHIGPDRTFEVNDPLVQQALESLQLCHVGDGSGDALPQSRYLIAAPLLDLAGEPYALLVVDEMPFYALQEENLQVIGLFLTYYTDGLSGKELAAPLLATHPECPEPFAIELQRLSHMHRAAGVTSTVVTLKFTAEAVNKQLPDQLLRMKRQLDEYWLMTSGDEHQMLAVLMPLANNASAEGYLERIEQWVGIKPGQSLVDHGIHPHVFLVGSQSANELLQRMNGLLND